MMNDIRWTLLVPLKQLTDSKTRMQLTPGARRDLAIAFAADVVAACQAAPEVAEVIVLSPERRQLLDLPPDVRVHNDPGESVNRAILDAAAPLVSPTAVVLADLPALRTQDVSEFLNRAASRSRSFVCDAAGVGTTALAALNAAALGPQFGPGSRARHRHSGAEELKSLALARLRRDVDTMVDLRDAQRMGVGESTAAVLAAMPD